VIMNGAQSLFKALTDAGLNTCFANPGTSEMQLVYEIGLTKGVRAVLCLQENTVTGAADGYGRMAGKPAFTLLHVGSGFANGIANIHNAGRANTTMVNIVGANATYHQANYPEHELINGRIVDLARVVSHWAHEAKSASDLGVLGALAARYARIGAGKICTVIAPTNCHWDPAVLRQSLPDRWRHRSLAADHSGRCRAADKRQEDSNCTGQPCAVWRRVGAGGAHRREDRGRYTGRDYRVTLRSR